MSPARADFVDANLLAAQAADLDRCYPVEGMARLVEAGASGGTEIRLRLRFSALDGRVALEGVVSGAVALTCQRCLRPVVLAIDEPLRTVLVASEADMILVPESHEAVIAEAGRFDLRWFAEEQTLLALPMVPMHAAGNECTGPEAGAASRSAEGGDSQRPFANLRDLLRRS